MTERNYKEVEADLDIWLPHEKGDYIEGEVVEISQGQYGIQLTIRNEKGELHTTPSHKVLQARIKKVKMGDFIKIYFEGTDLPKIKGHNPTQLYKVLRDEPKTEEVL